MYAYDSAYDGHVQAMPSLTCRAIISYFHIVIFDTIFDLHILNLSQSSALLCQLIHEVKLHCWCAKIAVHACGMRLVVLESALTA